MCGIAGVLALADGAPLEPRARLEQMIGALRHRGPDEFGLYLADRVGFAHARLSIIDLGGGQQPLANEDHTLWIIFNGEIFNYVELRAELVAKGHLFRTESDTEVIVHAFETWGDDAFAKLNGQFALALWDERAERLTLARDRLGVRPLYLCEHQGRLLFASEVKALFAADSSLPRELDPVGLEQTFTFWTVVAPQTVFRGIEELRPGYVRTYDGRGQRERRYYGTAFPVAGAGEFEGSLDDAEQALGAALEKATRLRVLRADVPVGSYLSGGLDSSMIAALGAKVRGTPLRTFSLRFADAEYDETPFQHEMVAALGSEHAEIVVTGDDIAEIFPEVIRHTERPLLRTAPAPLFMLSRLVHQAGLKVVLTGEGADEMLAGYDLFREAKIRRFWSKMPDSKLRPLLLGRLYPYLARSPVQQQAMARQFFGRDLAAASEPGFSHQLRWKATAALKRLFSKEHEAAVAGRDVVAELLGSLPREYRQWSPLAQDQYLEISTLLSGYLLSSQGDRVLMANSVEGRFPFLDIDVVALAHSLPPSYKLRRLDEKHVLKRVGLGLIPERVRTRPKQPYRAPDALAFLGARPSAWVRELIGERAVRAAGVFEPSAVSRLWGKCLSHRERQLSHADNMAVVGVLSTQLLHDSFVASPPAALVPPRMTTVVVRTSRARERGAGGVKGRPGPFTSRGSK